MTPNHTKMIWKDLEIPKSCVLEPFVVILATLKKCQKNIPDHKNTTKVNALRLELCINMEHLIKNVIDFFVLKTLVS